MTYKKADDAALTLSALSFFAKAVYTMYFFKNGMLFRTAEIA